MKTNLEFTPEELDLIAKALTFAGQSLVGESHSILLKAESGSIKRRGEFMNDLARKIRFSAVSEPEPSGASAPVVMQETADKRAENRDGERVRSQD